MKSFLNLFLLLFILLFVLSLNFPLNLIKNIGGILQSSFLFFELPFYALLSLNKNASFTSDSPEMLFHILFLLTISILLTLILKRFIINYNEQVRSILFQGSIFILAFFLLKYGVDKLVMNQFHYPEPNILHTEFGNLDQDILYWSMMGKSYSHNIFLGVSEILAGILLLIPKLRKLAGIISFGILVNVLMVNFSFGIEVKLLCLFLLLLNLIVIFNYKSSFLSFLIGIESKESGEVKTLNTNNKLSLKFLLIFLLSLEITYDSFSNQIWNYQNQEKSILYGSYQLQENQNLKKDEIILNSKTKRFYVNSRYYFITEDLEGNFKSYKALISKKTILLKDFPNFKMDFSMKNSTIFIHSKGKRRKLKFKKLPF
jgi:hypothetical protein